MAEVTTIGLDLGKRVLQVHGVDAAGAVTVRRSLRRKRVLPFFAELPRIRICIDSGLPAQPSAKRGMTGERCTEIWDRRSAAAQGQGGGLVRRRAICIDG